MCAHVYLNMRIRKKLSLLKACQKRRVAKIQRNLLKQQEVAKMQTLQAAI